MTHEVVAALIIRSNRILLGRRSRTRLFYPDVWDLFGGHVEPGEAHEGTLVRELREELGITSTAWRFLETLTADIPRKTESDEPPDLLIAHLYLVTAWRGRPANRQLDEHSAIGWFSLAQAIQLPLADPIYPELFARYLNAQ